MKQLFTLTITVLIAFQGLSQNVIKMKKINGIFLMPCKVNGLSLNFIFDTGASDVSISLTEALFMLKNGYLNENELIGTEYYQLANGDIQEGTKITLKEIEIGTAKLYNVEASIVHTLDAPLLLGQTALSKLGKIEFDYAKNTLTIKPIQYTNANENRNLNYDSSKNKPNQNTNDNKYIYQTTFNNPPIKVPLRKGPDIESKEIYSCPKDAIVYVIDDTGETYIKVEVNGKIGYLSKLFLK